MNLTIGQTLRELLKIRNVKHATLAKHIGISASRLSNYISGKRDPDLEMLACMAKYLGVDLNYFSNIAFNARKEIKRPAVTQNAIEVPVYNLNDKKRKIRNRGFMLDKSVAGNLKNPVIIETEKEIHGIFNNKTYILASPLTENEENGTIVLKPGRYAGIYKYIQYENQCLLYDLKDNKILPVNPNITYYAARLTFNRL